ncbi:acyl-CoA dehydrogenase family protein [Streptacidiphilus cavernicola]|uniref:Acyl-CoA dehydrogenase family protein n=1 Tax=Streptacidiphilus cavernicola TaxID=3342716 RepID=A0ABV6VZ30_9ACTN
MTTAARHPLLADAFARLPRVVDLLAARAEEHDRDACFPYQGIEAVHEAGLLTLTVAERYGGAGCGLADTVRVLGELGRGDPSVAQLGALTLLTHAQQARAPYWPEPVYADLLADSVRGPALVGVLGPEADGGPAAEPGATARRDGADWRLTGRAPAVAGAEALAWMVVTARLVGDDAGTAGAGDTGTALFLVQGDAPGVQVEPGWEQLGLRATASQDVLFDGVPVGSDAVAVPSPVLDPGWLDLALPAVHLGVARAARDWAVAALRRTPTEGQLHAALGRIEVELLTAEELLRALAERIDRGDPGAPERTGAARIVATRAAVGVVEQAVALSGSAGLSRAHPLERHVRDVLHARGHGPREHDLLAEAGRRALRHGGGPTPPPVPGG